MQSRVLGTVSDEDLPLPLRRVRVGVRVRVTQLVVRLDEDSCALLERAQEVVRARAEREDVVPGRGRCSSSYREQI